MNQYNFEILPSPNNSINDELHTINTISLSHFPPELKKIVSPFFKSFKTVNLPKKNLKLLTNLIEKYKIPFTKDELVLIGCAFQEQYYLELEVSEEEKGDSSTKDFFEDKKQYNSLFDTLEKFLLIDNNRNLSAIQFQFNTTDTVKIDNFFVLIDLYDAICKGYGLTKDNFEERKEEILSLTSQIPFNKRFTNLKKEWIKMLNTELTKLIDNKSDSLRCLGTFLHIFHVPTNNSQPIELYDDIIDTIGSIDIKNLRHSLTR